MIRVFSEKKKKKGERTYHKKREFTWVRDLNQVHVKQRTKGRSEESQHYVREETKGGRGQDKREKYYESWKGTLTWLCLLLGGRIHPEGVLTPVSLKKHLPVGECVGAGRAAPNRLRRLRLS